MSIDVMFSSKTNEWETPQKFFDLLNDEFKFTLDSCADETNKKCEKYFAKEEDGLAQTWKGERVFCNPPYGREIGKWVKKAHDEFFTNNCELIVMLIPARTDTRYFHDYIYQKNNVKIRFIKGRLRFGGRTTVRHFLQC